MSPEGCIALLVEWLDGAHVESAQARIDDAVRAFTDKDHAGIVSVSAGMLERNSLHESAHAVLAVRWGLRVGVTRVHEDGSGACEYSTTDPDLIDGLLAGAVADLAGIVSELLIVGVGPDRQKALSHSSDLLKARLAVDRIQAGGWLLTMKTLATMSASCVLTNRHSILRVAACLRAVGELSGPEISALGGCAQ
jgi:hypothetical protein